MASVLIQIIFLDTTHILEIFYTNHSLYVIRVSIGFQIINEDNDLIIVGDFNHPEVDWPNSTCQKVEDHPARVFLESVRDGLLMQHFSEATRWRDGQTPSTLDLNYIPKKTHAL